MVALFVSVCSNHVLIASTLSWSVVIVVIFENLCVFIERVENEQDGNHSL